MSSSNEGIFPFYEEPQAPAAPEPVHTPYVHAHRKHHAPVMPEFVHMSMEKRRAYYIKYGVDPGPTPLLSSIPLVNLSMEDRPPERPYRMDDPEVLEEYIEAMAQYRLRQRRKQTVEAQRAAEWKRAVNAELIEQTKMAAGVKPYRPQNIAARGGIVRNMRGVDAYLQALARKQLPRPTERRSRRSSPVVNRRTMRRKWMAAAAGAPVVKPNRRTKRANWWRAAGVAAGLEAAPAAAENVMPDLVPAPEPRRAVRKTTTLRNRQRQAELNSWTAAGEPEGTRRAAAAPAPTRVPIKNTGAFAAAAQKAKQSAAAGGGGGLPLPPRRNLYALAEEDEE